jgi:hypothetical protein
MSDMPSPPAPLAPEVSPLAEASPDAINEFIQQRVDSIINKSPLLVTDDELRVVVEYHRKARERFQLEAENKPARARAAAKPKEAKAPPKSVADAIQASADLL